MTSLGMIGLGAMGHSIAANILRKGQTLTVYDIRPEAANDLIPLGAKRAASIAELGGCEIVLLMVNTFDQCRACMEELLTTKNGGIVVVCSTIQMKQAQTLEAMAASRGVRMLDCPVSGGTRGAMAGTLTLMAAGADDVFAQCAPLLHCFGTRVLHVGKAVGQGQAVKAVNQLLVGVHMCAAAEAFNMARQCGLDLDMMFETIKASAGTSRIFENRGQFFIDRDYSTRSTLAIQLKDTTIACQTAADAGAPSPLGELCRDMFAQAVSKYPPTQDSMAVIRLLEEQNGKNGS